MSRVFDADGNRLKTYDENGREVSVISTLQASEEWSKQYEETVRAERIAIVECIVIVGLITLQMIRRARGLRI